MDTHSSILNDSHSEVMFERYIKCMTVQPGSIIYATFTIANVFINFPLCVFILYHGARQRFLRRSAAPISHFHCFSYHMALIEVLGILGTTNVFFGTQTNNRRIFRFGDVLFIFTLSGQLLFHVLTCVDRYLAVVHPVTYLGLRNEKGVRIRNASIACVWLVCFLTILLQLVTVQFFIAEVFLAVVSVTTVFFCCVSTLWVLVRPGPVGESGKADSSKKRAFYTMVVILFVLLVRISWSLLLPLMHVDPHLFSCVTSVLETWMYFPSSLVMPTLFLYKEGKCLCARKNQ